MADKAVGEDGLLQPRTELRRQIAELHADGLTAREIADKLERNYDYVRKALKDEDVRAHVLRCQVEAGKSQAVKEIESLPIRDWRELAPKVQALYDYILRRALEEPDTIDKVVGRKDDGTPVTVPIPNPLAEHFHKLAVKIAERVEDRAWGKVPQRLDYELTPDSDRLEDLKDHQLAYYRRLILAGISPNLALQEAKRLPKPKEPEQFGDFVDEAAEIQEAEILAIEGEVEEGTDD